MKFEQNIFRKLALSARALKKRAEEKSWYARFSRIVVFSDEDREILKNAYRLLDIEVIPLGLNFQDYPALPTSEKTHDLIFVGNFTHSPNEDAVLYFYRMILPLIREQIPEVSFVVAGANPSRRIKDLSKESRNISVTGYVENILDYYSGAKVFVAPLCYGTGMRFKILEAMAMGLPVVSTSSGSHGIPKDSILIADTPEEFCSQVIKLLKDPALSKSLGEKARCMVEKYFDLNPLLDKYENIYTRLLDNKLPLGHARD
jgi:glycosyltransferase involved in cell wall biosynthesis